MADLTPKKLSEIDAADLIDNDTLLPIQQQNSWKKATGEQLKEYAKSKKLSELEDDLQRIKPWQPTLQPSQYVFETAVDIGMGVVPVMSNGGKTATGAGVAFSAALEEFLSYDHEAGIAFTMDLTSATEEALPFGVWLGDSSDINIVDFMVGAQVKRENGSLFVDITGVSFPEIPPTATQFLLTVQRVSADMFVRLYTDVAPSTPLIQRALDMPENGLEAFAYYSVLPTTVTLLSKNETSFDYVDITDAGLEIDETDLPTQPSGNLYELSLAQDVRLSSLGRVVKDKDVVAFGQDGQPIQIIQEVNIPNIPNPPDLSGFATEQWVEDKSYATAGDITAALADYATVEDLAEAGGYTQAGLEGNMITSGRLQYQYLSNLPPVAWLPNVWFGAKLGDKIKILLDGSSSTLLNVQGDDAFYYGNTDPALLGAEEGVAAIVAQATASSPSGGLQWQITKLAAPELAQESHQLLTDQVLTVPSRVQTVTDSNGATAQVGGSLYGSTIYYFSEGLTTGILRISSTNVVDTGTLVVAQWGFNPANTIQLVFSEFPEDVVGVPEDLLTRNLTFGTITADLPADKEYTVRRMGDKYIVSASSVMVAGSPVAQDMEGDYTWSRESLRRLRAPKVNTHSHPGPNLLQGLMSPDSPEAVLIFSGAVGTSTVLVVNVGQLTKFTRLDIHCPAGGEVNVDCSDPGLTVLSSGTAVDGVYTVTGNAVLYRTSVHSVALVGDVQ